MMVNGRELTPAQIKEEVHQHGHVLTQAEVQIAESQLEMKRVGVLLLASEDGRLMLTMLEDMYYSGVLVGDDTHTTYFNLGRRDVVTFLRDLRDQAKKEK